MRACERGRAFVRLCRQYTRLFFCQEERGGRGVNPFPFDFTSDVKSVWASPALAPTASGAGPLARGPTRGIGGAIPPLSPDILDVERAPLPPPELCLTSKYETI